MLDWVLLSRLINTLFIVRATSKLSTKYSNFCARYHCLTREVLFLVQRILLSGSTITLYHLSRYDWVMRGIRCLSERVLLSEQGYTLFQGTSTTELSVKNSIFSVRYFFLAWKILCLSQLVLLGYQGKYALLWKWYVYVGGCILFVSKRYH